MPPVVAAAGVAAIGSIAGGLISSHSAGKAADTQAAAANAALAEQKRIFDIQQAQRAPYLDASQKALTSLQALTAGANNVAMPAPYAGGYGPIGRSIQSFGAPAQAPTPQPMPQPASMVTLQAPTGAVRQVPADQADRLIALGAKRIN